MFDVQNVTLHFGARLIVKNATFKVEDGARCAIIGPNGAGKSTLLKIIAGILKPESGSVLIPRSSELGYLPQDVIIEGDTTVEGECREVFQEVLDHEAEMRQLEDRMAHVPHDSQEYAEIAERYDYLLHEIERRDVYTMDATIGRVLDGLGFRPKDRTRKCREFSGGWQMRIALARLLLRNPDILLLDEPTNHLDTETIQWLVEWIRGHQGSVLMISHERYFMDQLVTRVVELDRGSLHVYRGNYSDSLEQRAERREMARRTYENQQQAISHVQKFIDRFRYQASKAALVQSRVKMLERIEMVDAPSEEQGTISFDFPPAPRSAKEVLVAEGVGKAYGTLRVLDGVDLTVYRGEKIALVGVNGAGKSTLMSILAGRQQMDRGKVSLGGMVQMAYFAQYDKEDLHPDNSVLDEFLSAAPLEVSQNARGILGAFLFRGDDVEKKVKVLSGGERTRLRLAKMLCGKANLLLLDEPTNHLDLGSRLTLEEALRQYEGAVVIVSHDRYFLDAIATRVVEVKDGQLISFPGGYGDYLERKRQEELAAAASSPAANGKAEKKKAAAKAAQPAPAPEEARKETREEREARQGKLRELQKRLKKAKARADELEHELYQTEETVTRLENRLSDPAVLADHRKVMDASSKLKEARAKREQVEKDWLAAQVEAEECEAAIAEVN
jgi:ATP-binding cassette subfamily F protein 3